MLRLCVRMLKMKSTLLLLYTLVNVRIQVSSTFEIVKLTAVIGFPELDQLYRDTKANEQRSFRQDAEDVSTKLQICEFIFGSTFFDMNHEDPVRLNSRRTYIQLYERYPDIFEEVYGSGSATTSKKVFRRYFSIGRDENPLPPKYYDENDYRERRVWVQRYPTRESVFVCLTRDRRTENIKQYYVSKVYDVSKHSSPFTAVAGRFIFGYDHRNEFVLRALAEEPAEQALLLFTTIEKLYTSRKETCRTARTPEEDPVCRLTKSEKLRVCNQIFSGSEFKNLIRFYPRFMNVEEQCTKKRIDFEEPDVQVKSRNFVHEEWVIGCKTLVIGEGMLENITFYVSTGYSEQGAFLYGELDGRHYIIYYTNSLSVWDPPIYQI